MNLSNINLKMRLQDAATEAAEEIALKIAVANNHHQSLVLSSSDLYQIIWKAIEEC